MDGLSLGDEVGSTDNDGNDEGWRGGSRMASQESIECVADANASRAYKQNHTILSSSSHTANTRSNSISHLHLLTTLLGDELGFELVLGTLLGRTDGEEEGATDSDGLALGAGFKLGTVLGVALG
jgi:hypothetical protein